MSIKDYKTKDGIIIGIKPGDGDDAGRAKPRKGYLPPLKPPTDFLHRRSKPGFIKFYDTNQTLTDGNYFDNQFQSHITINYNVVIGSAVPADAGPAAFTALADTIAAVPLPSFETKFRELIRELLSQPIFQIFVGDADAGIFANSLDSGDLHFTEDGLKLSADELASPKFLIIFSGGGTQRTFAADAIQLTGSGKNKITATRTFADPAVPFTPGAKDKYFLLPAINHMAYGSAQNSPSAVFDNCFDDWRTLPTSFVSQPSGNPFYNLATFSATFVPSISIGDYGQVWQFIDYFKAEMRAPQASELRARLFLDYLLTLISPAGVPDPAAWPHYAGTPTPQAFAIGAKFQHSPAPAGTLAAIIKQESSVFYVWT